MTAIGRPGASPPDEPSDIDTLRADWFDGHQARARPVRVWSQHDRLHLETEEGLRLDFPLESLSWPEATRHGQRVLHMPDDASLCFSDGQAFDTWRRGLGHADRWVERAQQRWRTTLVALALLVAFVAAAYAWGVPWVAEHVAAAVPEQVEAQVGELALAQMRSQVLKPSSLPQEVRSQWQERLDQALARAYPQEARASVTLHLAGGGALGANAMALPGGHIVLTDELVELLRGADDTLLGVLAHEHGHLRRRHGLQGLVRLGLVSAGGALLFGDFSAVIGLAPALAANLDYGRRAEREADADAATVLLASGRDPAVMVLLFERLAAQTGRSRLPIAFATHPGDEECTRFFREVAAQRR